MVVFLSVLFFCSGASALIYQVLWLRLMGLVFGVTVYAASTVWATFMAGLAVGSFMAGRAADRTRRPLVWFGAAELLVGATALLTPAGLSLLQRVYAQVYPSLSSSAAAIAGARVVMTFAVLIVPTALMGATLPLVIKSSSFRTSRIGKNIGLLYGMNTAGAIVGALAAGVYLVPQRGIRGTFLAAATLNLIVGVSAILLGVRLKPDTTYEIETTGSSESTDDAPWTDDVRRRLVLWIFAISGFTSLALEVVWTRVLTLFLRPTVYGFALMLAAVLAGIAAGSCIVTPFLDRRRSWVGILGLLEIGIGIAAVLSFGPLARMEGAAGAATPILSRIMAEWLVYPTVGSLLAIFPTALFMGLAFPVGLRLFSAGGGSRTLAERIGTFYSLNVAGAIFGSFAAGFFLLPHLGSRVSLALLGSITAACGVVLIAASEWRRTMRLAIGAVAAAVLALAIVRMVDPFEQFVAQRYNGERLIWREEGVEATAAVLQGADTSLTVNGNHQASTGAVMLFVHRAIGHLPMMLHPDAHSALVIGLGGGATAGAVSIHDHVDVDVVELAASVVHGARFLDAANYGILRRPNAHVHVDDGRNYMMVTKKRYDIVTADTIHPIFAGSGNLYSVEYFRLVRRVLKPGGIAIQWANGTDAEYKAIARTFMTVFPNTTVWKGGEFLVGTVEPLRLSRREFEWKLNFPGRLKGAKDIGADTFDGLLQFYTTGPQQLREFVGAGPILTDDRPLVEYFLSLPRDKDVDFSQLKKGRVSEILAE